MERVPKPICEQLEKVSVDDNKLTEPEANTLFSSGRRRSLVKN